MSRKSKDRKKQRQKAARQNQSQQPLSTPVPTPNVSKCQSILESIRKEKAAQLVAEENLIVDEIALAVGVDPRTIYRWKEEPAFAARVEEIGKKLAAIAQRHLIARKNYRLANYQERLLRMQQVMDERAASPAMKNAPGGEMGLLVRKQKMIGSGSAAFPVEEYEVDTGLLKAMLDIEKQAAQEAGQWVDKVAPTTPEGDEQYNGIPAPDLEDFRKLPVAERIRLLGAPVRSHPPGREESSAEMGKGTVPR